MCLSKCKKTVFQVWWIREWDGDVEWKMKMEEPGLLNPKSGERGLCDQQDRSYGKKKEIRVVKDFG